jgi:hypothetical protein
MDKNIPFVDKDTPTVSISSRQSDPIQRLINATALERNELLTEKLADEIRDHIASLKNEQGEGLAIGFMQGTKFVCILNAAKKKNNKALVFVQKCFPPPLAEVHVEILPHQLSEENYLWLICQPGFEYLKSSD